MVIKFDVPKERRRELVTAMGEIMHAQPEYMGLPSKKYKVACFLVSSDCQAEVDDGVDREVLMSVLEKLAERGFRTAGPDFLFASDTQERAAIRRPALEAINGERITWLEGIARALDALGHPATVQEIKEYMPGNIITDYPPTSHTPYNTIAGILNTHMGDSSAGAENEYPFRSFRRGLWGLSAWTEDSCIVS